MMSAWPAWRAVSSIMWNMTYRTLHSMMSFRAHGVSRSLDADRAGLLDLLPVRSDPVVHGVALVDHQVGVPGLGFDLGPPVGELAAGHDDLEPAGLPGRGMLHQPQQRQRARGR